MPSNLSSAYTVAGVADAGPRSSTAATVNRCQIASAVGSGVASMDLIGRKIDNSARSSSFLAASPAVAPMSPSSMFACFTSSSDASKARAIASSTRPSRKPIRKSPVKILTRYSPSRADKAEKRSCNSSAFAIGPRALCRLSNSSRDCRKVNGLGWVRPSSTSNALLPASPCFAAMW